MHDCYESFCVQSFHPAVAAGVSDYYLACSSKAVNYKIRNFQSHFRAFLLEIVEILME